jgi:hypothetical protein
MNNVVRSVRHIHVQQIAYTPSLFQAIITYEPHPYEFDESDELERQKGLVNKLVEDKWFVKPRTPAKGCLDEVINYQV